MPQPGVAGQPVAAAAHPVAAYKTAADTQSIAVEDLIPDSSVAIPVATDIHLSS